MSWRHRWTCRNIRSILAVPRKSHLSGLRIRMGNMFRPPSLLRKDDHVERAGPEGIACWFIDTDYNEESFFVRHAYFLGANDPYSALKTTLKAEVNEEVWATLT